MKADVKEIQSNVTKAAQKDEKVDEGFILRLFRNIARMAPEVLDLVVAMLANPLAGLGMAVKKIAEKAKEDAKKRQSSGSSIQMRGFQKVTVTFLESPGCTNDL